MTVIDLTTSPRARSDAPRSPRSQSPCCSGNSTAPALTYLLRLFVTMIHELGHGLAAILTGARFSL